MRHFVLAVALAAACKSGTESGPPSGGSGSGSGSGSAFKPAQLELDGMRLGKPFDPRRAPYQAPCDDDAIDEPKTRRALIYGATPCGGAAFPDGTSFVAYVDWADGDDFARPLRAVAWIGGTYFDSRSNFPLRVGEPAERCGEVFGEPEGKMSKVATDLHKTPAAWIYPQGIWCLEFDGRLVGFAVGELPDITGEGGIGLLTRVYEATPKPPAAQATAVSRDDCAAILDKADRLIGHDSATHPREPAKREREIDECVANATPAMLECAKAATTHEQLRACEKR